MKIKPKCMCKEQPQDNKWENQLRKAFKEFNHCGSLSVIEDWWMLQTYNLRQQAYKQGLKDGNNNISAEEWKIRNMAYEQGKAEMGEEVVKIVSELLKKNNYNDLTAYQILKPIINLTGTKPQE